MKIFLNCLDLVFALILLGPIFTKNKMIAPILDASAEYFNHGATRIERASIKNGISYLAQIAGKVCIFSFSCMIIFFYFLPKPKPEFSLILTIIMISSFYIWFAVNWIFNHRLLILGNRPKDKTHLFMLIVTAGLMFMIPEISIFRIVAEMFNKSLNIMGYELIIQNIHVLNVIGVGLVLISLLFVYLSFWIISSLILIFIAIFVLLSILAFKLFSKYFVPNEDTENKFLSFVLVSYLVTQILLRFAYG